jgi:predicted metal-binding protein
LSDRPPIKRVGAGWAELVLVCRRCSKRLGGGFGPDGKQRLAKALRREIGLAAKGKKARRQHVGVIEVGCLDVCPKGAVVAIRAAQPDRWLVIPRRTPVGEVAERLGLTGAS